MASRSDSKPYLLARVPSVQRRHIQQRAHLAHMGRPGNGATPLDTLCTVSIVLSQAQAPLLLPLPRYPLLTRSPSPSCLSSLAHSCPCFRDEPRFSFPRRACLSLPSALVFAPLLCYYLPLHLPSPQHFHDKYLLMRLPPAVHEASSRPIC